MIKMKIDITLKKSNLLSLALNKISEDIFKVHFKIDS